MKLIDSHAHLDFEQFRDDFDDVLARASESGVEKIINIGANLERSHASITLAEKYANVFAVVGIHPEEAVGVKFETVHDDLMALIKSSDKVVGVGETGLDYYNAGGSNLRGESRGNGLLEAEIKEHQKKLFRIHVEIAKELELPLVIHIRNGDDNDAVNDAYELLVDSGYHRGVIHCFTLDYAWAKRFTDLGFNLGFTGIVTYKNSEEIQAAIESTSIERILIETDCPFLAPQKYRGQRNEPSYVTEVAKKVAEIKNLTLENVAKQTTINVEKLFNI